MAKRLLRHFFLLATMVMVAACGGGGDSGGANVAAALAVRATAQPTPSLILEWNSNTETDLAGYKIYAATSSGGYGAPVATVPANATSFVATGVQRGVTYFFVITAFNTSGDESPRSNEASGTVPM